MDSSALIKIKGGLLNTQSVGNKTFEIREMINSEKYDLLAVTETWLDELDTAKISEMTPLTHTFLHIPRKAKRGGGVGIFLINTFKKMKVCKLVKFNSFEHMQVSCEIGGRKCIFVIVYRPPNLSASSFIEDFRLYLETIDMVSANTFVFGDFNLWVDVPTDHYGVNFMELMESFNLINKVNSATSEGGHMLDLVFTNKDSDMIDELYVDEVCCISPVHKLITFTMPFVSKRRLSKTITYRSKRNFESQLLITEIKDELLVRKQDICAHTRQTAECTTCFTSLYNNIARVKYENMCPVLEKQIVIVDSAPWFNADIQRAKRVKKKFERLWRRQQTDEARENFKRARNAENKLIVQRKREYYMIKAGEAGADMSKLYMTLDNLTGNKRKNKLPEGIPDATLANNFSDFFCDKINAIVEHFSDGVLQDVVSVEPLDTILTDFTMIDLKTIKSIVTRVKLTHCGNDPIPVREIVQSNDFSSFLEIYVDIVNCSIKDNEFPQSEKKAIVKPIIKGSLDPQCLSSFRPVSNLTFLSKVIENVILNQLWDHLSVTQALPDSQSAYRRLYSTETTMCSVINDLLVLMDNGKCGILILLDLSAAFDTVVHKLLLEDCKAIGISDNALAYLQSYLTDRTYCVQIGDEFSEVKPLERGVPQGSVLGPILFCIYTIELSRMIMSHGVRFKLFADDTQFYLTLSDVVNAEEKISGLLRDVGKWMESKQLKLNERKTECLLVGRQVDLGRIGVQTLNINENVMVVSSEVKDLGVLVDSELSFRSQINQTVRIAAYHLRNIAFIRKYLDSKTTKMLIHNHVITKLDYCNSIYYGLPNYLLRKLQLMMNRAARLIKGLPVRASITPALIDLHWLPVKARIIYKVCVMVYQALNPGKPKYMRDLLVDFQVDTSMTLRHGNMLHQLNEPRCNHEFGFRAFEKSAPRLYNKLPINVKDSVNIKAFKKSLKTHLFRECFDLEDGTVKQDYKC